MPSKQIRYAVVGLGYFAQVAALPAFKHAKSNSVLTALVSGDSKKLKKFGKELKVPNLYSYEEYDECLRSGEIDAVYIALPNNLHCEYTVRALRAGIHVLCEKPLAVTEEECLEMTWAASESGSKLMTAYRLHFDEANLKAAQIAQSGKLGKIRFFNSTFSMGVKKGNIRLEEELGGGTLYDIGIYCINAARSVFKSEPYEVFAYTAKTNDSRFKEVEEMTTALLRFPDDRLASFTCSFGGGDVASYQIVGTKGDLIVSPAFHFAEKLGHQLTVGGKTKKTAFAKHDQFGPELLYFSKCILKNLKPEPSGLEGLADVKIIQALYQSARIGQPVSLKDMPEKNHPELSQQKTLPPSKEPTLYHAVSPSP